MNSNIWIQHGFPDWWATSQVATVIAPGVNWEKFASDKKAIESSQQKPVTYYVSAVSDFDHGDITVSGAGNSTLEWSHPIGKTMPPLAPPQNPKSVGVTIEGFDQRIEIPSEIKITHSVDINVATVSAMVCMAIMIAAALRTFK